MNLINLLKSAAFSLRQKKTPSDLLRIHLRGKIRFANGSPLEGAMYINLW